MTGCEALLGAALFACLADKPACLPQAHAHLREDLKAIAEHESRFWPWAVRDERVKRGFYFKTRVEAVAFAVERDRMGHTLGLGLYQITHRSGWDRHFGPAKTPEEREAQIARALDPCANMTAGAAHLAHDMQRAAAYQFYNSNRADGAPAYAAGVLAKLRRNTAAAGGPGDVALAPVPVSSSPVPPARPAPTPRPVNPMAAAAPPPPSWYAAVALTLEGALP